MKIKLHGEILLCRFVRSWLRWHEDKASRGDPFMQVCEELLKEVWTLVLRKGIHWKIYSKPMTRVGHLHRLESALKEMNEGTSVQLFAFFLDRKFCIKARLSGALLVTMATIKNNSTNFRVLHPALQVLKIYTTNSKLQQWHVFIHS